MARVEWIMSSLLGGEICLQKTTQHSLPLSAKPGSTELRVTSLCKEGKTACWGCTLRFPLALRDVSFLTSLFGKGWFWTCSRGEGRFTGAPQRENNMGPLGQKWRKPAKAGDSRRAFSVDIWSIKRSLLWGLLLQAQILSAATSNFFVCVKNKDSCWYEYLCFPCWSYGCSI